MIGLRDLVESHGKEVIAKKMIAMLNKGGDKHFRESHSKSEYLVPDQFSIREMWEAFVGPCGQTLNRRVGAIDEFDFSEAAVDSTAFSVLTGTLLSKKVIEGYEGALTIGDQLVTLFTSRLKNDDMPGVFSTERPVEVIEGMPYQGSSLSEKWARIGYKKFGRILDITEEAILFDQTGMIMMRALGIGNQAAQHKEENILNKVQDKDTDVYQPAGVAEAMYTTNVTVRPNGINLIGSNELVDEENLSAMRVLLAAMKDDRAEPISGIRMAQLLGPDNTWEDVAWKILNSNQVIGSGNNDPNIFGPNGRHRPTLLTSPFLTAQSATDYYGGDFKKQFMYKETWPLQTFRAKAGNEEEFTRDIKVRVKVRYAGQTGASDTKFVIKSKKEA